MVKEDGDPLPERPQPHTPQPQRLQPLHSPQQAQRTTTSKDAPKRGPKWVVNWLMPLIAAVVAWQWTMAEDGPVVEVETGLLRGRRLSGHEGIAYFSFKGIPYAKPPTGSRRFMDPERAANWTEIRAAYSEGPVCSQAHADIYWLPEEIRYLQVPSLRRMYNIVAALPHLVAQIIRFKAQSEDCLYLNVFTKELPSAAAPSRLRPVIVWIHGGAFYTGTANSHIYGPDYLLKEDVVVVNVNYRLGVLGFLALQNADSHPANAGLKDQRMALRWVQNNIEAFGGDPSRVTLMGESAGAASVHYHLLSGNTGLFHAAIAFSGSSWNPWAYCEPEEATQRAFRLARNLGGRPADENQLVDFLQTQKPDDLIRESYFLFPDKEKSRDFLTPFVPSVEKNVTGAFLTASPLHLLKKKKYSDIPFLTGINDKEGMIVLLPDDITKDVAPTWENLKAFSESPEKFLPDKLLKLLQKNGKNVPASAQRIRQFYFGNDPVLNSTHLPAWIDYWGDVLFSIGVVRGVHTMAENGLQNVFMYLFTFDGKFNLMKKLVNTYLPGVSHADELGYLFPVDISPAADVEHDSIDTITRNRWLRLIANFARTGHPTPLGDRDELIGGPWKPVSSNGTGYLDLGANLIFKNQRLFADRMAFWDKQFQLAASAAAL